MTPSIIQIAVVTLIAFIYGAEKNAGQILTNMSVTPAWVRRTWRSATP